MKNLYKIKDFAKMLGVTSVTLRNKHKTGELIPSYIDPNSNHRFYTDELAYRYNRSKYILAYSCVNDEKSITMFHDKLSCLNIRYKLFIKDDEDSDFLDNQALKDILREVNNNSTYTILYDKTSIVEQDLNLIKLYLESCYQNVQLKDYRDFSCEPK